MIHHLPVTLPLDVARCPATRTVHCILADSCARALVDGVGRYSQDYSIEARPSGKCIHYMPSHQHRGVVPVMEPKVHEPLGSK